MIMMSIERGKQGIAMSPLEYAENKARMVAFFQRMMNLSPRGDGFPRWQDSADQLIENAYQLWQWRVFTDKSTGRPMTFREIATRLCCNLHVRMPANIYAVARYSRSTRRLPVVEYFAMLWREARLCPEILVTWEEPITLPKPTSYRGLFTR
mgnify:CR=1 FL=1